MKYTFKKKSLTYVAMVLASANTMARYRKGADNRRPAAHTRGSALGVFVLSARLTCTPLATPRTPVTQVMAPKIRLTDETDKSPHEALALIPWLPWKQL